MEKTGSGVLITEVDQPESRQLSKRLGKSVSAVQFSKVSDFDMGED